MSTSTATDSTTTDSTASVAARDNRRASFEEEAVDEVKANPELPEQLVSCEEKIEKWRRSRLEAGRAMRRIEENGLHHRRGYENIEDYAEEHFEISRSRWSQLVAHADTYDLIADGLEEPLPSNEAQTRPLHPHRDDPDLVVEVWEMAANISEGRLTKPAVETALAQVTGQASSSDQDTGGSQTTGSADGSPDRESPEQESPENEPTEQTTGDDESSSETGATGHENEGDLESGDTRLEEAREDYGDLLGDLNEGVAEGLLSAADLAAGESSRERSHLETARSTFEGLAHREPSEEDESPVPGCITENIEPIDDQDVLIAMPTELLTPEMAELAVPIGVPQAQYALGVPLSYFDGRPPIDEILAFYEEQGRDFSFTETNENVDWAAYTTNQISGCLHTCSYCYARYQAEGLERYKQGFQPTFFPGRLLAFSQTASPEETSHPRDNNVFVGSMSDIFGQWVPEWMIQSILDEVEENEDFDHLFLTKFPQKLDQFEFPDNAWVGTTVDRKHRVALAERHFQQVDAPVKWLSCEPLKEDVAPEFDDLSMFDCVVIGAQKAYGGDIEEDQPELDWVIKLYQKARDAGCKVYFKENLDVFPKELPNA